MGTYTEKLNLYKTNMLTDGNDLFDFKRDLDDNWDKIDTGFATLDTKCDGKQDKLTAGYNIDIESNTISASGKYPYSFNSGNVDSSGNADLISYSGSDVTYKVGNTYPNLTGTQADGQQFEVESITADDVSGLADGDYIKFVGSDDTTDLLNNKITVAKVEPTTPADNDVWINNAVNPLAVKKYVEPNYINDGATIDDDGIASGFSATNKITFTDVNLSDASSFDIYGSFTTSTIDSNDQNFLKLGSSYGIQLRVYSTYLQGIISSNGTSLDIAAGSNLVGGLLANTKYDYHLQFTGTKYSFFLKTSGTEDWGTDKLNVASFTVSPNLVASATNYIGSIGSALYFKGSIDLSDFKIYKNGDLIYQPNIGSQGWQDYDKVPLGKITVASGTVTGVKTYPYNKDYISNNIVKSYRNGSSGYEVHADGYCIQWGRVNGANSGTVNLSYSYSSALAYNIQLTSRREDSTQSITTFVVGDRTASSFDWFGTASYTAGIDWLTTGYVEIF